jgi:tetratricopeptide (TPR) repeat protein
LRCVSTNHNRIVRRHLFALVGEIQKVRCLFAKFLLLVFCMLVLIAVCHAEKGTLVIQVSDIHNQPVANVELAAKGSSESGITDRFGRARIKLDPQTKVNDWIILQITRSPAGKDLVFISPWDAHVQVPPFENETTNFLPLVMAERGDRALLENGKALTTIVARINKANSPKSKDPDPEQQRQLALATIAEAFGLAPDEVDKAIRAWGERANDPYEKGLAALYENNYPLASRELSQSLEMREKELAKAQAAAADAAFFLGQSKYEEGKYVDSVAAYRKALNLRPDDTSVMNHMAVVVQFAFSNR